MIISLILSLLIIIYFFIVNLLLRNFFKTIVNPNDHLLFFLLTFFVICIISYLPSQVLLFFLLPLFIFILVYKKTKIPRIKIKPLLLLSPYFIILLLFSIVSVKDYDSYLYHLQSISWAKYQPFAIGITNIHQRLGFSSVWFHLHSQLGFIELFNYPLSLLNPLIIFSLFLFLNLYEKNYLNIKNLFLPLVILVFSSEYPLRMLISGYNPDIPSFVFTILFFIMLMNQKQKFEWIFTLFLISILAAWIKISTLPLLFFTFIIYLQEKKNIQISKKQNVFLFLITFFWTLIFLGENVLKSGYLIYPMPFLRLPVFWAELPGNTIILQNTISSWAKVQQIEPRYYNVFNFSWIPLWISKRSTSELLLFYFTITNMIFAVLIGFKNIHNKIVLRTVIYLIILFLYWFLIAPDFRFGYGIMISALYIFTKLIELKIRKIKIKNIIYLSVLLIFIYINPIRNYLLFFRESVTILPSKPIVFSTKSILVNNITYFVPLSIDEDRTGFIPFPSAPNINSCLKKITKKDFEVFYVNCD